MRYQITHTTTYDYATPVSLCQNIAHLTPRTTVRQHLRQTALVINPQPAVVSARTDYFGNLQTSFAVQEPHRRLSVAASHLVEVQPRPPLDPALTPPWDTVNTASDPDTFQFTFASRHVPLSSELADYARPSFHPGRPLAEAVLDLTARMHRDFQYDAQATTVSTPVADVFRNRRGVCQDFAHLQLACLRTLGLPARYVSGYLRTTPPPGQPHLRGADASHAWIAVYCPTLGWLEVDPTNNLQPSEQHIILAWGRDFDDVSPIKGVILGGEQHTVRVAVDVEETA